MSKDKEVRLRIDNKTDIEIAWITKQMGLNKSQAIRKIISEKCWDLRGDNKSDGATK